MKIKIVRLYGKQCSRCQIVRKTMFTLSDCTENNVHAVRLYGKQCSRCQIVRKTMFTLSDCTENNVHAVRLYGKQCSRCQIVRKTMFTLFTWERSFETCATFRHARLLLQVLIMHWWLSVA